MVAVSDMNRESVVADSPSGGSSKPTASATHRFLVVNADDFGRNEAVNLGVAEGFRRGIVTSTSLVATGPGFESAVAMAPELSGLGIGVHLAIDEYRPVVPASDIPSLVDAEGRFFSRGKQFLRMASNARIQGELLREWDSQITKILRAGIQPTHIDGHGHCHAHPAVAHVVLQLAERYGIAHVRMPAEAIWWMSGPLLSTRFGGKVAVNCATQITRRVWQGKLHFPQSFYGFSSGGHMTKAIVCRVAESAAAGVSELMVHVGVSNDEAPGFRTGYNWMGDLDAVTRYTREQFEKKFGVKLVTHANGRQDAVK